MNHETASVIISFFTLIGVLYNGYTATKTRGSQHTMHEEQKRMHTEFNGKMDEALQVKGDAERAMGNLQGRADQKAEDTTSYHIGG